ncbi:myb-binding protein 1A-like protein [Hibiscus syriacus]|uniref:myb-binding protein 1A-like protein n=1 Tax=Hibiscus syriacus TaxID=106335 RepID=UPI0019243251|nr:myb-binding protein 1A-like protein [Hibiscus syriacus]XP_039040588.1 myb-binding protein 1A-like protein [Hibiscus syriacus]
MGSKKRSTKSEEEVLEGQTDLAMDDTVSVPSGKNIKMDNIKDAEMGGGVASSSSVADSIKPMERKKKRKQIDKERRRSVLETEEPQPKQLIVESKGNDAPEPVASSSSSSLPEFHISVFKDLASADSLVREAAVETMVTELQEVQKAYDRLENKDLVDGGLKLEAQKDDGLDNCASSLQYAVRRLIRGVSSSRECVRQGFALGLTTLVATIPSIKLDSLLKLIVNLLEVSSSMKGQEVRDCLLGRLFAYGAIARSGRLTKEWFYNKDTHIIKEFMSAIISLASKKRYLQEASVSIILEIVEKLPAEALLGHILEAPGVPQWFEEAVDVGNPDALLLALKINEKTSIDSKFSKLLPNPFSPSTLFSADHLSSISNCLKESTFCQPRVHSLWPVLVNILLPDTVLLAEDAASASNSLKKHKKGRKSSSSEEEIENNVQSFCDVSIGSSLLLSSHDRKHLAFDILLLLLPRLPPSFIPIVVSSKVVQCLMDILSTKDSWLYKVALHFLKELLEWVRNDDVRRVAVIVAFQKHSSGKFDCITKTKTVKDLMAEFKTETGCMLFVQNLVNLFLDEGLASEEPSDQSQTTDENSEKGSIEDRDFVGILGNADFLKGWVIESLPSVLKHLKLDPEAKFRVQREILKFLSVQGLFSASLGNEVTSFELQEKFRWPKATTSTALCKMCIEQLQLLLASAQKVEEPRSLANALEPNDLGSYFMRFFSTLRNIPSVSLFRTLSDKDKQSVTKLLEMESKLYKEERNCRLGNDANKLHAFRYLLILLLLQVLLRPGEFCDAASELIICCKKAFAASDDPDSSGEDESNDDAAPELMDVLMDTLLSLLPQLSASMRSAIEQVFRYICGDVTDDGLLRMLRIIKKDLKPARHQEAGNEDEDDLLGIEEDEDIDEAETGETADSDEQSEDSEAVVGGEGDDKDLPEESDESDGGMDDDAMFRMDTYLAQIFKEKKNQAGGETAQSQLVLFKLRVLSLLEIYLHENRGKPQVLTVYSHLAQAFVNPHTTEGSEQLGQRIWGIIQRKVFKEKKLPKDESMLLSTLESLLEKNLKLASKPFKRKKSASTLSKKKLTASLNRYKMVVSLAQNSTYWILKIIEARNFSDSELQGVFGLLRTILEGYFDSKKSQIKSGFLKEIFKRNPRIGHQLFSFLLENCGNAKSDFRRVEALDLVIEVLKSQVPMNSNENNWEEAKKFLKSHLQSLGRLIETLVKKMPEKRSRKTEVHKCCDKIFQMITSLDLTKAFLRCLGADALSACESQIGPGFLKLNPK